MLHVDASGRVLGATHELTGDEIPYVVRKVTGDGVRFRDSSKIKFYSEKDRENQHLIPPLVRYFGEFLARAEEVMVYRSGRGRKRHMTVCSYLFAKHSKETRLPMNFDYATCRLVVPVDIDEEVRDKVKDIMREVREASAPSEGYGHPGITDDERYLEVLGRKAWDDVKEDVIATPYYPARDDDWYPVLREDGRVGLYRGNEMHYVVVENALPYFVCDQLRIVFAENPNENTWERWTKSAILERAEELSQRAAVAIAERAVAAFAGESKGKRVFDDRETRVFFNRLVTTNGTIRYDDGIVRATDFDAPGNEQKKAIIRLRGRGEDDADADAYALIAMTQFEDGSGKVFPATVEDEAELREIMGNDIFEQTDVLRPVA